MGTHFSFDFQFVSSQECIHIRMSELGLKKNETDAIKSTFDVCGGFQGGFDDFVEILKIYDKNSDKTNLENELFKLPINHGEKLSKEEATEQESHQGAL